jgi:hypothetical protein
MDYMDTVRRGWQITWNHKWLWLLGFLAALGSGGSSFGNSSNYQFNAQDMPAGGLTPEMAAAIGGGVLLLLCVFFIVGILLWLVSLASRGGLITSVVDLARGETSSFGKAFRQGWRKVLPLLLMTILLFAALFILVIVVAVVFAATIAGAIAVISSSSEGVQAVSGILFGIGTLCVFYIIILAAIVQGLYPFAYRGMMLHDLGVMDSIRHGLQILRNNLGDILVLGLIFLVINIHIGVLAVGVISLLGFSTGLFQVLFSGGQVTTSQWIAVGLGFLATALVFAAISAIVTAWRSATFTLAYVQWTGKDAIKETVAPIPPAPTM